MSHEAHDKIDDGGVHPHIAPVKMYIAIFLGLIFFTVVTVAVGFVHLGPLNLLVAIVIATIKAALVVIFFMHLKDDAKFNALVFVGSLLFAGVFLVYTMNDTGHRGQIDPEQGVEVLPSTGEFAPGGPARPARSVAAEGHEGEPVTADVVLPEHAPQAH
ncbi:MAG: cytochrome C oxidase subunit IV family protein [Sandaracinaceae bacterium]|nr:cytochrome C oxidase subunit IV family protein [Sandaracinaceae bacterium]